MGREYEKICFTKRRVSKIWSRFSSIFSIPSLPSLIGSLLTYSPAGTIYPLFFSFFVGMKALENRARSPGSRHSQFCYLANFILMCSISYRCDLLAHIAWFRPVNDIYCFLWSLFAEPNRSTLVTAFQFYWKSNATVCLFSRFYLLRVSASRTSQNGCSCLCFLELASVSDWFQICWLPDDPNFLISGFLHFLIIWQL